MLSKGDSMARGSSRTRTSGAGRLVAGKVYTLGAPRVSRADGTKPVSAGFSGARSVAEAKTQSSGVVSDRKK